MLIPDKWLIMKIDNTETIFYKVFASWSGSFLNGDSWKINSGIKDVLEDEKSWDIIGYSSSIYSCGKGKYGITVYGSSVLDDMLKKAPEGFVTVLDEDSAVEILNKFKDSK